MRPVLNLHAIDLAVFRSNYSHSDLTAEGLILGRSGRWFEGRSRFRSGHRQRTRAEQQFIIFGELTLYCEGHHWSGNCRQWPRPRLHIPLVNMLPRSVT